CGCRLGRLAYRASCNSLGSKLSPRQSQPLTRPSKRLFRCYALFRTRLPRSLANLCSRGDFHFTAPLFFAPPKSCQAIGPCSPWSMNQSLDRVDHAFWLSPRQTRVALRWPGSAAPLTEARKQID